MNTLDKAIAILAATQDGDALQPEDLGLVQSAVNGNLNDIGTMAFERLHNSVADGSYMADQHWFHGIEHLTRDHQGYVYWKGRRVEHYSFSDKENEAKAARGLAEKCRQLEANNFPVNGRTAISENCYTAPTGTPWTTALMRYYTFFRDGHQVIGVFYRLNANAGEPEVVAAYKDAEGVHLEYHPGAYEAFHALEGQGRVSADSPLSYADTEALLIRTGLSGAELDEIITASL